MQESKKLSIAYCAKFLKDRGGEYTDEQVAMIRDVLYNLAELDYLICKEAGFWDQNELVSEDKTA